jgi:hypothetical protein
MAIDMDVMLAKIKDRPSGRLPTSTGMRRAPN